MADERKVLIHLDDVKMHFPIKKEHIFQKEQLSVKAVDGITLDIYEGETLGLVGESGCGKSTLGRVILQLYTQTAGSVRYNGITLDNYTPQYAYGVAKDIVKAKGAGPEELSEKHAETVRMAGGLLLADDLEAVSRAWEEKLRAVSAASAVSEKLYLTELQLQTLSEKAEHDADDRKKEAALKGEQEKLQAEYDRLAAACAAKEEALAALRKTCEGREGFEALEAKKDHSIDLHRLTKEEMRRLRRDMQMVFQDPYSSLNPRFTVGQLISEALGAHGMYEESQLREDYTLQLMDKCGLQNYMLHRYPHQFSGGQRQRIGIARALALRPRFVVCDEAVSALDVSIQSQIINLLMDLKKKDNLTYLFISHDLSAVKFISDRVGVMYLGNLIELSDSEEIFHMPLHPYTNALLDAIPTCEEEANKELQVIEGDIPSPIKPPSGCKFHTRCKYCTDRCKQEVPEFREYAPGHYVACHYPVTGGRS